MNQVIGMKDYTSNGDCRCWLCCKSVSLRAIFCHSCGSIQPVRAIDHFARLGLDRRIDIDAETIDANYAAIARTLDPVHFLIRGIGEKGHAARQLEALNEAYHILREPIRRGRYWLTLHAQEHAEQAIVHPAVQALREELENADEPAHCDRVAQKAGHAMQQGIVGLMQALRGQNWGEANETLTQLDGLEAVLTNVREKRAEMTDKN